MSSTILSSPDGSCLFSVEKDASAVHLRAYHWSSFGSTTGIALKLSEFPSDSLSITSLVNRSRCHFVGMNVMSHGLQSSALDITHKATEFIFRADRVNARQNTKKSTAHNALIDCHSDVWTRFPVVPAVQRQTVKSANRSPKSLLFVCDVDPGLSRRYFTRLVSAFESATRKPTGGVLDNVAVDAAPFHVFSEQKEDKISIFPAGEWIVDILCLIPIHLAVARDNHFIPLKDGIWSTEQERSLLGATVDQVIDSISFGWYESIFQSYMASKVRLPDTLSIQ